MQKTHGCTFGAFLVQFWCIFGALTMDLDDNTAVPKFLPVPFGLKMQFWCKFVKFWCNSGATFGNFWCIFGSLALDFDQNTVLRPIFLRCFRFRYAQNAVLITYLLGCSFDADLVQF